MNVDVDTFYKYCNLALSKSKPFCILSTTLLRSLLTSLMSAAPGRINGILFGHLSGTYIKLTGVCACGNNCPSELGTI